MNLAKLMAKSNGKQRLSSESADQAQCVSEDVRLRLSRNAEKFCLLADSSRFIPLSEALLVPRQDANPFRRVAVYALSDPRDGRVRYVGKTAQTLLERLAGHAKRQTNQAMRAWFRELRKLRKAPAIDILEFVEYSEWEDAERGWIRWFCDRGELLNVDPGGEFRDSDGCPLGIELGEYEPPECLTSKT